MLVYVVAFGFSTILGLISQFKRPNSEKLGSTRKITFGVLAVFAVLAGISALRWRVGTDYRNYDYLFPIYASEVRESLNLFGEPGIRIIAWLAMYISGDSAVMFAIASIMTVGLFVRTLWRWSPVFAFSIAIYVLSGAWYGSFNVVRQYLACAILFAGHRFIIEKKFFKWTGVVLLASLFHVSALVGMLFYLIPSRRTSLKIQLSVIGLGIVGALSLGFFIDIFAEYDADRWGTSYAERSISLLRVVFAFLPATLYWVLKVRTSVDNLKGWFYVNMLFVYGAVYIAAFGSTMAARFALYPLPFIALGLVYVTAVPDKYERIIVRLLVASLYAVFMFVEVSSSSSLSNFQWIFERE